MFPSDVLETYTRSISKPGFLRAGLSYFGAAFEDEKYFTSRLNASKLEMPLLVTWNVRWQGAFETIDLFEVGRVGE